MGKVFPDQFFTTGEVIKVFPEIKMESFQDWLKRGFIKPCFREKKGQRSWSYFTESQLYQIALFHKFVNYGVKRAEAYHLAQRLHTRRVDNEASGSPLFQDTNGIPPYTIMAYKSGKLTHLFFSDGYDSIIKEGDFDDVMVIDMKVITEKIEAYEG